LCATRFFYSYWKKKNYFSGTYVKPGPVYYNGLLEFYKNLFLKFSLNYPN